MVNGGRDFKYSDLEKVAAVLSNVDFPIEEDIFPTPAKIRKYFPELYEKMLEGGLIVDRPRELKMVQDKEPGRAVNPNVLALTNLIKLN